MIVMWNYKFSVFIIIWVLHTEAQKEGRKCLLEDEQDGVCKKMTECPSAIYELDEFQKYPPICSYDDFTAIVCCDERSTSVGTTRTTPKTTTSTQPSFNYGKISKQKCREYSAWAVDTFASGAGGKPQKRPGRCGFGTATFVVGGSKASKMEFPHMVHIGFGERGSLTWECGGSLISERYVLTAAHCRTNNFGVDAKYVKLGSDTKKTLIYAEILQFIQYPQYNRSEGHYNDIALIQMNKVVRFNDYLRPACLQVSKDYSDASNPLGIATGWGLTDVGGNSSKALLKVGLPFMNHTECSKTYLVGQFNLPQGLDRDSMICAGGLKLNKDTCNGDSGGPLQIVLKKPYCMYSIVGITSFGIQCGIAPGVYTSVYHFLPWIEGIVWP